MSSTHTDDAILENAPSQRTAISRGMLNVSKLGKLSSKVLEMITTLTAGDLTILLAVLGKDHFDFLALPVELRCMVYDHVLLSSTGSVTRPNHSAKRRLPGLALLSASKDVHDEAYSYLTTFNECTLKLTVSNPRMDFPFHNAISFFRRLHIKVETGWEILPLKHKECRSRKHAARKLAEIVDMLNTAFLATTQSRPVELFIEFDVLLHQRQRFLLGKPELGLLDPNQTFVQPRFGTYFLAWEIRAQVAFIQTQLAYVMDEIYEMLDPSLPLTVTTNVDCPIAGVEVQRVDKDRVDFRIAEVRQEGFVGLALTHAGWEPSLVAYGY